MAASPKPTLWRTCRALANRHRLRLLGFLVATPNQTVSGIAQHLDLSLPAASQYLRALNARGLLRAERKGRSVRYRLAATPGLPGSEALVAGIEKTFASEPDPVEVLFQQVTAYTHPRRVMVAALLRGTPLSLQELQRQSRIPLRALHRHLGKLVRRGVVVRDGKRFALATPSAPMAETLLHMATENGG